MKELAPPHNDWYAKRDPLTLGRLSLEGKDPANPHHVAAQLWRNPTDAGHFSDVVRKDIDRLIAARVRRGSRGLTLRQELRSLFNPMEINLVYDTAPFAQRRKDGTAVELPSDFFVDARLLGGRRTLPAEVKRYEEALAKAGMTFAADETPGLVETHHAFSVPVRSHFDERMIDSLVERKLLDEELIAAVLAVDLTTPLHSAKRAGLLRFVPEMARDAAELRAKLVEALRAAPDDPAAKELLEHLTDPKHTAAAQRARARAYWQTLTEARSKPEAVLDWLRVASQRRQEMIRAETAPHPIGTVNQPGFKGPFPTDALK